MDHFRPTMLCFLYTYKMLLPEINSDYGGTNSQLPALKGYWQTWHESHGMWLSRMYRACIHVGHTCRSYMGEHMAYGDTWVNTDNQSRSPIASAVCMKQPCPQSVYHKLTKSRKTPFVSHTYILATLHLSMPKISNLINVTNQFYVAIPFIWW